MHILPKTLVKTTLLSAGAFGFAQYAWAQEAQVSSDRATSTQIPATASPLLSPPQKSAAQLAGSLSASSSSVSVMPLKGQIDGEVEPMTTWTAVLGRYTMLDDKNLLRFNYAALKTSQADMEALTGYIEMLSAKTPSLMDRNHALAYWANLYNAQTVRVMVENYPVKSIRKIKSGFRAGPWKRKFTVVEGNNMSLDDIEHGVMRPQFNTPLVHYMVNCASIGCPNLKASPWRAQTLEADLDFAARAYINSARGAQFKRGRLKTSSIYNWFQSDFGGSEEAVIKHLMTYADADLKIKLKGRTKIDKYGYDWAVNAQ